MWEAFVTSYSSTEMACPLCGFSHSLKVAQHWEDLDTFFLDLNKYKIPMVVTLSQVFSETASRTVTYDIPADSALNVDGFRPTN